MITLPVVLPFQFLSWFEFLSPRELFELTERLFKLLELPDVMSEMDRFKNEHPFVCPKCRPQTHVVFYTFTELRILW